jgi:hypothetical protein
LRIKSAVVLPFYASKIDTTRNLTKEYDILVLYCTDSEETLLKLINPVALHETAYCMPGMASD